MYRRWQAGVEPASSGARLGLVQVRVSDIGASRASPFYCSLQFNYVNQAPECKIGIYSTDNPCRYSYCQ